MRFGSSLGLGVLGGSLKKSLGPSFPASFWYLGVMETLFFVEASDTNQQSPMLANPDK